MYDYIIMLDKVSKENFEGEIFKTLYLKVKDTSKTYSKADEIKNDKWVDELTKAGLKDVLVFVHGYNEEKNDILKRHRKIKAGLKKNGYTGEVVTFNWPCGNNVLNYLDDRHEAKQTALRLATDCISILAKQQQSGCTANIHLLAHSTGAYVVREAFNDADDMKVTSEVNWKVSQVMFISGDVSSNSMRPGDDGQAIYDHCVRFTNYFNPFDVVLGVSNVKRLGIENRVGRVGLTNDVPAKCVDVNCGNLYDKKYRDKKNELYSHSWYFDDSVFMKDMFDTIQGSIDRNYIPTRKRLVDNDLELKIS